MAITLGGFVLLYTVLGVIDIVLMYLAARRGLGPEEQPGPGRRRAGRGAYLLRRPAVTGPVASLNTAWFA